MWQISYPPAIGASQGNYFLPKSHNLAVFEEKQAYKNSSCSQTCKLFFNWFLVLAGWNVKLLCKIFLLFFVSEIFWVCQKKLPRHWSIRATWPTWTVVKAHRGHQQPTTTITRYIKWQHIETESHIFIHNYKLTLVIIWTLLMSPKHPPNISVTVSFILTEVN